MVVTVTRAQAHETSRSKQKVVPFRGARYASRNPRVWEYTKTYLAKGLLCIAF
jgi:hypothetical protein